MVLMTITLAASAFVASAATPTVSNVTAKQRYPWNGMVDITCTVSGISGTTSDLKFSVAAVNSGNVHGISQFWVVRNGTNSTDHAVHANGTYHLVWDSKADFDNQICSNMVMRVNLAELHDKVQLWEGGPYWATTNIGAEKPEDYGYYFWWGDTIGYKRENDKWVASDGSSSNFCFDSGNTPTCGKGDETLQKIGWITADGVLAPAHDAAHVHWGGDWRMPTKRERSDLNNKCDWTWTTQNGVQGYVVKGKGAYASASIFLPCTGYGYGSSLGPAGSYGYYWSSVPSDSSLYAWDLYFDSSDHFPSSDGRYYGQSVRPVQGFTTTQGFVTTTVILDRQGGNGGTESVAATYGNAMPSITVPTRPGYIFGGYYAGVNGNGTQYYTASSASARDWDKTCDTTLYAMWTTNVIDSHDDKVQLWENGPYWATTNIGAEKPEDYGYYFWWGDTIGYKRENDKWVASDGSSSNFCFDSGNTPTCGKGDETLQKIGWITADGVLAPAHDAAHVHWGGAWRMPTYQELSDLCDKCDWTWTTRNGVNGCVVRGRGTYASNSIFLPCAGYGDGTSLYDAGSIGYFWSSVPYSDYDRYAWYLYFYSSGHSTDYYYLHVGLSVRAVQGFTN